MKNNLIKIISIAIIICMFFCMMNIAMATDNPNFDPKEFEDVDNPIEDSTKSFSGIVISVLRVVGATVAIVMLLVIAMKYMTSAPGDKADIKKHAVAYVIGAVILFGVSGILGILVEIAGAIKA